MTAKGEVIASGDPYEQTRYILSRIKALVVAAGFRMEDIVRTRLYVTNIARWDDYARAHREAFENIRPTSSMVQVVKLVDPRLMIEMEVDAVKGASSIEVLQLASD
jgi:enamine deaminase RidA (YjgF/YER057c/UK114 family)